MSENQKNGHLSGLLSGEAVIMFVILVGTAIGNYFVLTNHVENLRLHVEQQHSSMEAIRDDVQMNTQRHSDFLVEYAGQTAIENAEDRLLGTAA